MNQTGNVRLTSTLRGFNYNAFATIICHYIGALRLSTKHVINVDRSRRRGVLVVKEAVFGLFYHTFWWEKPFLLLLSSGPPPRSQYSTRGIHEEGDQEVLCRLYFPSRIRRTLLASLS